MIALTVHQPWASLIAQGMKRVEYRTWRPSQALLDGEPLVICASARAYGEEAAVEWRLHDAPGELPEDLPLGAALVVVRVLDVLEEGDCGWLLDRIRLLEPIAVRGRQRLWRLEPEAEAEIRRQLLGYDGAGAP